MDAGAVVAPADTPQEVLKRTIDSMIEEMKTREIKTDEDYQFLDDWQKKAKLTVKTIDGAFEAERIEKKAPYDAVLETIRTMKKPIELALPIVISKMTTYITERERARRAEVARLEAESKSKKEDDRIVEAENLTAMGRADKADELLDKKITVSRKAVVAAAPVKLGKTAERWTVTIKNKSDFLRFAAVASIEIFDSVEINTSKLEAIAREHQGLNAPGVEAVQTFVPIS